MGHLGFEGAAVVRLLLASVCGGLIGIERGMKGQAAGSRTFSLVCMGAALAMLTNEYILAHLAVGTGDVTRMASQVISGIGFLGAGTIMMTSHNQVKGLTTAAALWVTAAIGIAIGCGFYLGGLAGVAAVMLSSNLYWRLDRKISASSRYMSIYVEGVTEEFMLQLVDRFQEDKIKVLNLTRRSKNQWYQKDIGAVIELDLGKRRDHGEIMERIRKMKDLRYVEEV